MSGHIFFSILCAGFLLMAGIGMFLYSSFRTHLLKYHPSIYDGLYSLNMNFMPGNSIQGRSINSRRTDRALASFLRNKDYLALKDAKLNEICRRIQILKIVYVLYIVSMMVSLAVLADKGILTP